jgi:hypothetical protein
MPVCRRILYKLRGPSSVTNLPLSEEERLRLDGLTLDELLRSFRSAKE